MIQVDAEYKWVITEYHWFMHQGYARAKINNVALRLHVFIAELEFGKIPNGYVVHHINEDKLDNRVANLQVMLRSDHARLHATGKKRPYMIERNTSKEHKEKITGDNCYMSKASDQQWLEAIELYFKGVLKLQRDISAHLGLKKSQAGMVLTGATRKHLQPDIQRLRELYTSSNK